MAEYMETEYIKKPILKIAVKSYFKHLVDKGKHKIDVNDANADINRIISELSTADVVEVIRCKDCAFSVKQIEYKNLYVCLQNERFVRKDDFCSYGERKAE